MYLDLLSEIKSFEESDEVLIDSSSSCNLEINQIAN